MTKPRFAEWTLDRLTDFDPEDATYNKKRKKKTCWTIVTTVGRIPSVYAPFASISFHLVHSTSTISLIALRALT
jgi:hypothetical protein